MLRELSRTSLSGISSHAQQTAQHLYQLIDPSFTQNQVLEATTFFLNTGAHEPSFPPALLGEIYRMRGHAHIVLHEYQRAMDDYRRCLALLDPTDHGVSLHTTACF